MIRHETPQEVACALARWSPRHLRTVLDPAVGSGILISSLLDRSPEKVERVVGIDTDPDILQCIRQRFGGLLGSSLSLVCTDFLRWEPSDAGPTLQDGFDCIIMNPPFAGKRKFPSQVFEEVEGRFPHRVRFAPLEGAFVLKAIRLLKPGGRLLAILPNSIMAADSGRPIRHSLLTTGSIVYVHELPAYTFPHVEARVYLLVYEKAAKRRAVVLCNHRLVNPDRLVLSITALGEGLRLDYEFQATRRWHRELKLAAAPAGWSPLREHAEVRRGSAESPSGAESAVHSTDFHSGFWFLHRVEGITTLSTRDGIRSSDLLVKRVGRRCAESVGPVVGSGAPEWTDCLICIRPKRPRDRLRLLFALRTLLAFEQGRSLLQRGTGASYITERDLRNLSIPFQLSMVYPQLYASYLIAVRQRNYGRMLQVEQEVHRLVGKQVLAA